MENVLQSLSGQVYLLISYGVGIKCLSVKVEIQPITCNNLKLNAI